MTLGQSLHSGSPLSPSWRTTLTRSCEDLQKGLSVLVSQVFPANGTAAGPQLPFNRADDEVPGAFTSKWLNQ